MTGALVLALCCASLAGEIHTPGSPTPIPTPTSTSSVQESTDGATSDGIINKPGLPDSLTEVVLDLLAVLPSLL
jgi:hypothetical protein